MTTLLLPAMGLVLLVMGRRLFWLFVGVAGFAAGVQTVPILFGPQPFGVLWAIGLGCGVIGALLALFFQRLAVIVGGFLAGATIALHLLPPTGPPAFVWVVLTCGLIGAVAMFLLFDGALIFLSSMIGATLIIDSIGWQLPFAVPIHVTLVAAGVAVQAGWMRARRRRETG